jgi:hypothetical protein
VLTCSVTKKYIKYLVCTSDLRCTKGSRVSFWDLKVCKKSLRSFLGIFLFLTYAMKDRRYAMLHSALVLGCDAAMCSFMSL